MKVFLSLCFEDQDIGTFLENRLRENNHQIVSANILVPGDNISDVIKQMILGADAFVTIVSKGSNTNRWQQFEWRTALELSWDRPDYKIIGIVQGRTAIPSFLLRRQIVRITKASDRDIVVSEVLSSLRNNSDSRKSDRKLEKIIKAGSTKLSSEIDKFRITLPDLEKEKEWLLLQIDKLSKLDPNDVEIAKLQLKLADILLSIGDKHEVVKTLRYGLDVLDRSTSESAIIRLKIQEKLGLALEKAGEYEGAIDNICLAINSIGIDVDPIQVKNRVQQCQVNIPEFVAQVTESLGNASHESATYGRRMLETLQHINESSKKIKSAGGES